MVGELLAPRSPTIVAVLNELVARRPDALAFTFLRDGEVETGRLTFGELHGRALAVASRLTALGAAGDRAILLFPQGLDFIVALFGCFYAGVIAVPANIPARRSGVAVIERITSDSGARWILSKGALAEHVRSELAENTQGLTFLDLDDCAATNADAAKVSSVHADDIALLQYTSGSTGSPRGVSVTHANIVANHRDITASFGHTEDTVNVSWLPMFHDMGLGSILGAVWSGCHCVLMSPQAFLQNPLRWLRAISRYRATSSGGPDFAYDLCARRIGPEDRKGLDLSSWRAAYNGSESVRASTLERFAEAFAPCGFRKKAFHPVYGLAEATLLVSSEALDVAPIVRSFSVRDLERGHAQPGGSAANVRQVVSCGGAQPETEIIIVDPESREKCHSGRVGEIWIRGPGVAAGYWGKDVESEATFRARTSDGEGPYLRTGDLGFAEDGHLFVAGRHKDLVIIRGRNHYPEDIEASVARCHPALLPNGCAAFSVEGREGERLVIVQEVARTALRTLDANEVVRAIRSAVSEDHALHTHAVVLLKPSTLPRTSSGKVRHAACRQGFLENSLAALATWGVPAGNTPNIDTHPESERRQGAARAEQLVEWLRCHAADLVTPHSSQGTRAVSSVVLGDLAEQGLLGLQVEREYGGLGLSHFGTARVLEQVAAFDFGLGLSIGFNNCLGIQPIAKYATPRTKALLLPGLVHGRELAAFAFQEPGAGKIPRGLSVQARSDGEDEWRLFGTKYLDGVAEKVSILSVFARHDEPPGISAFAVTEGVDGLRRIPDGLSVGVLGFNRETVALEGVKVSRENLLGPLGAGVDIACEAMMHTRLAIGAACVGGMKRCAQLATREAGPVEGTLTPNPVTLSLLGSITASVDALECLVHRVSQAIDAGLDVPSEAFAACRILGPDLLLRAIDDIMQLDMGAGRAHADRILAMYRDAGLLRHFDGPPVAIAERIGAALMDGDASLMLLVQDVLGSPDVARAIAPALDDVRRRMANLRGPLATRAQRWGHTRAGELSTWLVLLGAVDGARRTSPTPELARAYAWARAHVEHALTAIRFGTPSETAALETSDIAATFAVYSRTIGDLDPDAADGTLAPIAPESTDLVMPPSSRTRPASVGPTAGGESLRRELRSWIVSWLSARVQIPVSRVDARQSFADHGLDSLASVELAKALSDKLGRELDETILWNFATIDSLVAYLVGPPRPGGASTPTEAKEATTSASRPESQLDDEMARLEEELRARS